jgi:hypothetical protein
MHNKCASARTEPYPTNVEVNPHLERNRTPLMLKLPTRSLLSARVKAYLSVTTNIIVRDVNCKLQTNNCIARSNSAHHQTHPHTLPGVWFHRATPKCDVVCTPDSKIQFLASPTVNLRFTVPVYSQHLRRLHLFWACVRIQFRSRAIQHPPLHGCSLPLSHYKWDRPTAQLYSHKQIQHQSQSSNSNLNRSTSPIFRNVVVLRMW